MLRNVVTMPQWLMWQDRTVCHVPETSNKNIHLVFFRAQVHMTINNSFLYCEEKLMALNISIHIIVFNIFKNLFYVIVCSIFTKPLFIPGDCWPTKQKYIYLKGEHKSKIVRREIFLPVKELPLNDKYTPSVRFWSLSLFC